MLTSIFGTIDSWIAFESDASSACSGFYFGSNSCSRRRSEASKDVGGIDRGLERLNFTRFALSSSIEDQLGWNKCESMSGLVVARSGVDHTIRRWIAHDFGSKDEGSVPPSDGIGRGPTSPPMLCAPCSDFIPSSNVKWMHDIERTRERTRERVNMNWCEEWHRRGGWAMYVMERCVRWSEYKVCSPPRNISPRPLDEASRSSHYHKNFTHKKKDENQLSLEKIWVWSDLIAFRAAIDFNI